MKPAVGVAGKIHAETDPNRAREEQILYTCSWEPSGPSPGDPHGGGGGKPYFGAGRVRQLGTKRTSPWGPSRGGGQALIWGWEGKAGRLGQQGAGTVGPQRLVSGAARGLPR